MEMIKRSSYLNNVIPFIDTDLIKVLVGIRRSGKTILLSQIQQYLLENGTSADNILSINFESRKSKSLKNPDELYDFICGKSEQVNDKLYIFLDEIQEVNEWEKVVPSLKVDIDCDIYITGSNAKLLSGELATYMSGRYVKFIVYPFTLTEIEQFYIQNDLSYTNEQLFSDYLKYGGLPQRLMLPNDHSIRTYLEDVYESIVIKDIIYRNKINNIDFLRKLLEFLLDNIGNTFSANSIYRTLKNEKLNTTVETILNYIDMLLTGMIISKVERYDIKGKNILTTNEKYYANDLGLRNISKSSEVVDSSKLFENVVYLELISQGWDIKVGKLDSNEVDFVCYKNNDKIYVQVAYLLTDSSIEREFGNLEKINDFYPKIVISADLMDFSRNGIKHFNIIDFLMHK